MATDPVAFIRLRELCLCLDCEVGFPLGAECCPACGSRTWVHIARWFLPVDAEAQT